MGRAVIDSVLAPPSSTPRSPRREDPSFRRYAVAALSVAALAAVSGCGSDVHPGQAAVVEDSGSRCRCRLVRGGLLRALPPVLEQQSAALAMSTVRALSLDVLVRDELAHQYAEDRGWTPPASYRDAVAAIDDEAKQFQIAASDVDTFRRVREAEEYANFVYAKAAEEAPGGPGRSMTRRPRWPGPRDLHDVRRGGRRHARTAVRHRLRRGSVLPQHRRMSVPVTTWPGAARSPPQSGDTSYVDSLPADQECG